MDYFQLLALRFFKLWIEKHFELGGNTRRKDAQQLYKEINGLLHPRVYREVEE